jgi:hypothetical protein
MKDGIHSGLPEYQKALEKYGRYNKRSAGPLLENRAARFRFGLFRRYRDAAKTKQELDQELAARGYRIRRRKGKNGKTLTPAQEIRARKSSLKYLAFSFVYRGWKRSKTGQNASIGARGRRFRLGLAILRTKAARVPTVRLISYLPGAAKLNRRDRIEAQTARDQVRDMERYIARKHAQKHKQLFARIFGPSLA